MILNPDIQGYAITPLQNREVQATTLGRLSITSQKHDLTPASLVIATKDYPVGTILYLKGDSANQPWNGQVQSIGDKVFVLCPSTAVVAIEVKR